VFQKKSTHVTAVLQAVFVTFLWSTSWVFIKFGLVDIPPLPFAGLRYFIAFLCLLPFALHRTRPEVWRAISGRLWLKLFLLGILFYAVTQGAQFLSLFYLPAITTNMLLSFSAVTVTFLGLIVLAERPSSQQWAGLLIYLLGVFIYFYPAALPEGQWIGLIVAIVGVVANTVSAVIGRDVNRAGTLPPITITVISMGFGSIILLLVGIGSQGIPPLSVSNWLVILWLAVVNSAFAFTLWNHTLRTLSAMESSLINNLMMIQIPLLAFVFLGERLTGQQLLGLILAGAGIFVVQIKRSRKEPVRGQ
jgi:drug/metabolite transporter (DMT)-like permease